MLSCQRNDGLTYFLIDTVQTERQIHVGKSLRTSDHGLRDADGRNQKTSWGTSEQARIREALNCLEQILFVVKRFSHSHKHDVMQKSLLCGQNLPSLHDLIQYLSNGQVLNNAHVASRTEFTGRRTTNLTGNTQSCSSRGNPENHSLDLQSGFCSEQQFCCPIDLRIVTL